ncbi:DUF4232 domain-containing protein [Streptomyces caeruleatus]|uniref:DUF4232 domain-containing protein n=1 Tax=Streptomyces caeruleatus TaxID=661399 RepID=A0A101TYX5_9ACTN|nr:DUF4232 domain-containing protein [Streptomyces caeruleatus]KUO01091.1 hypothetical protein AQJ67_23350 [Streptomyces caeruleatus]
MPTASRTVPAAFAGVLLLAACGSQSATQGDDAARAGGAGAPVNAAALCPSGYSQYGSLPSSAGDDPSVAPSGTPTPLPLPSLTGPDEDGVQVTGLYAWEAGSGCQADYSAAFEITNSGTRKATYTVTFSFLSSSGGAVDNVEQTVQDVAPGRTVKGAVAMKGEVMHTPEVSGVDVLKVRSVPADEAPSASGPCPASGVHVYADQGDAAMGLRVVGLRLVNCGTKTYELNGYPELELLDERHGSVDGVRILQGTGRISTAVGGGDSPRPVTLRPGEAAQSTLAWRNTTGFGDPVNVPYVRVRAKSGAAPVIVQPELDLGTTGQLGVGPWQKDETSRATGTGAERPTSPLPSPVSPTFPSP